MSKNGAILDMAIEWNSESLELKLRTLNETLRTWNKTWEVSMIGYDILFLNRMELWILMEWLLNTTKYNCKYMQICKIVFILLINVMMSDH